MGPRLCAILGGLGRPPLCLPLICLSWSCGPQSSHNRLVTLSAMLLPGRNPISKSDGHAGVQGARCKCIGRKICHEGVQAIRYTFGNLKWDIHMHVPIHLLSISSILDSSVVQSYGRMVVGCVHAAAAIESSYRWPSLHTHTTRTHVFNSSFVSPHLPSLTITRHHSPSLHACAHQVPRHRVLMLACDRYCTCCSLLVHACP